jgi:zinc transporter ZupT
VLNLVVHFLLDSHSHGHELEGDPDPAAAAQSTDKPDRHSENNNEVCACCADHPVANLERVQRIAQEMVEENDNNPPNFSSDANALRNTMRSTEETDRGEDDNDEAGAKMTQEETRKLKSMSLNTAVAIAIHNFPEGLATFVAALADPKVGAVLAIAIAIHNIPEGKQFGQVVVHELGTIQGTNISPPRRV